MYVYFINVPMNEHGVEEFETYDDVMPNVKTYELTEKEYNSLRKANGLFDRFDSELGTIIDVCEEERIELSDIDRAIQIAEHYMKKLKDDTEISGCEKIIESLKAAKAAGTFWEIDIYLD